MTFRVEYKSEESDETNGQWVVYRAHVVANANADVYARTLFQRGKTVRVVSEGTFLEGDMVLYTLTPPPITEEPQPVEIPRPLWAGVLPLLILGLTSGTPEVKAIATEELRNMAKAADLWNDSHKTGG